MSREDILFWVAILGLFVAVLVGIVTVLAWRFPKSTGTLRDLSPIIDSRKVNYVDETEIEIDKQRRAYSRSQKTAGWTVIVPTVGGFALLAYLNRGVPPLVICIVFGMAVVFGVGTLVRIYQLEESWRRE